MKRKEFLKSISLAAIGLAIGPGIVQAIANETLTTNPAIDFFTLKRRIALEQFFYELEHMYIFGTRPTQQALDNFTISLKASRS